MDAGLDEWLFRCTSTSFCFLLTAVTIGDVCEEGYTLDTDGQNCTGKHTKMQYMCVQYRSYKEL